MCQGASGFSHRHPTTHRDVPAQLEGHVGRGQWVDASDVAEERVPAALNYLFDMGKASAAGYFDIFHFIEPAH